MQKFYYKKNYKTKTNQKLLILVFFITLLSRLKFGMVEKPIRLKQIILKYVENM